MKFIVTVKLKKKVEHDPNSKIIGECPVNAGRICTDMTGEHHSFLHESQEDDTPIEKIKEMYSTIYHVTRIEAI